jgi:hypothetical protein
VFGHAALTIFSLWTVVALVLGFGCARGVQHASNSDLAAPLFGASATLVALILPAAALANTFLEGRMLDYVERVARVEVTDPASELKVNVARSVSHHFDEMKSAIDPLLRGFVFLLVGLGFSIGALFHSEWRWSYGPHATRLRLDDLFVGGGLGFDVVGVLLLFPFAWLLLDTKLAEQTSLLLKARVIDLSETPVTATATKEPAPAKKPARAKELAPTKKSRGGQPAPL